jgi:C1q domain
MSRIVLLIIAIASAACSSALGLNDVTRGDAGAGELDRIAALEDQIAALRTSQDAMLAALKPIAFRASLAKLQTALNDSDTPVKFDHVDLDTHHGYDPATGRYVIPVRGEYVVVAIVSYQDMETGRGNCELWVDTATKSGVQLTAVTTPSSVSSGSHLLRVTSAATVQLEAGDRVYVAAFQDSGGERTLFAEARSTNFQIVRIPSLDN